MGFYDNLRGIKEKTLNLDPENPKLYIQDKWIEVPHGYFNFETNLMWSKRKREWMTIDDFVNHCISYLITTFKK